MKKNYLLVLLLSSLFIAGCNGNENNSSNTLFSSSEDKGSSSSLSESSSLQTLRTITIDKSDNGYVEANKLSAYKGDKITLTIHPDEGYELIEGNLKYNDTVIQNNTFIMPDENVVIKATFTKIPATYPETDMIVKSKVNNNEATAYYEAKYTLAGVQFKITVIDNDIVAKNNNVEENDAVYLLVNKKSDTRGLETNQTIKFVGMSNGYYELYRATSRFNFTDKNDPNLNVAPGNNFFTEAYSTKIGNDNAYVIDVYFGYDLLGTTYQEGYQNITFCPGLTNANSDGVNTELGQKGYSYYCYWKNAATFALINDENNFTQRATGTDADILDETIKPENYIYGANFVGSNQWSMAWIDLATPVSLENATALLVEVRFNEANNGDWFRLGAKTSDDIFYDAFGKNSSTSFRYSVSENIKEVADYNWETGQWGGWDPSWNTSIAPTYYVEVPLEYMFARFGLTGNMSETAGTPLNSSKTLSQIGIYLTANSNYNFSIGRTYVRRNGQVEQISSPDNYSLTKEEGKDYIYSSKIDSDSEKDSSLEITLYKEN